MSSPSTTTPPRELILGIDLGTTNSLIAICDERGPRIIPDAEGDALLPSVVRFLADGETVVGREARMHAVEDPTRTVASIKRLMGRGFGDVQDDLRHLSYEVVPGEHDTARVNVDGRVYSPQEISAIILRALKHQAEAALRVPVRKVVITVPAYFDDAQRQATRDAGRLAGLEVVRIVNEPTAAALAYGIGAGGPAVGRGKPEEEIIAVYDLGGGTFDISILRVTPGEAPARLLAPGSAGAGGREPGSDAENSPLRDSFFQVLSTAGDTHLGGDDVDRMIMDLALREIHDRFEAVLPSPPPPSLLQTLRDFAETVKIRLSTEEHAVIRIDLGDGRFYERTLTRDELERMIEPWVARTIESCERAVRDAKLSKGIKDIQRIVMVGGSTRIPLVRRLVGEFFDCEPYVALDPDQVVALGAAVQASILSGLNRDALLLDVVPLSLGIETQGGAVAKLIMRNTTVPAQATEMFSTSVDDQTNVKIHVLQGERELVRDCRSLGQFDLRGVPPMPAGIPQIQVQFLVDANGILNVAAVERRSGKRASIQIAPRYGLSREEVDRLERESFAHAREDMHAHRIIDLAVNAQLDIKWISEAMQRVDGPPASPDGRDAARAAPQELDPAYRAEIHGRIATLRDFIEKAKVSPGSVDADAFQRAKEDLDRASVRLHEISIARSLAAE